MTTGPISTHVASVATEAKSSSYPTCKGVFEFDESINDLHVDVAEGEKVDDE